MAILKLNLILLILKVPLSTISNELIPVIFIEIILPILIIIGYRTKLSAGILALFCLITGFVFHFDLSNQMQVVALLKNIGLAGGMFFLMINGPREFILIKKKKFVRL